MLRSLFRFGVMLYPQAFRREYGRLIIACFDDTVAAQPHLKAQRLMALQELARLPSSIFLEHVHCIRQTHKHSVRSIVIAALILSVSNVLLTKLIHHSGISNQAAVVPKLLATIFSAAITAFWLGFSYRAFSDRPYRYVVAGLAVFLTTIKVGLGVVLVRFYLSQLFGYQLTDTHGHWSPLAGPVWYTTIWLYYAVLLGGTFMIAHAVRFSVIKLNPKTLN